MRVRVPSGVQQERRGMRITVRYVLGWLIGMPCICVATVCAWIAHKLMDAPVYVVYPWKTGR